LIPEFWFWQSQVWCGGLFFCDGSFKIAFLGQYFFSKQVSKFSAFSLAAVSALAWFQVGFVESLKLASRFFARVSVCGGFDWLCFVASALFLLALQGFQNRVVFSWQRLWQKYKSPFFSRRFGQRKISSFQQSV